MPRAKTATAAEAATSNLLLPGRLAGKVALITGAAGNLGGEIVRHYLRQGAVVVLSGRTQARLNAALDSALTETGVPPTLSPPGPAPRRDLDTPSTPS